MIMTKTKTTAKNKKNSSKKKLEQAPATWCFWVHYGPVLGNLADLEKALQTMSEEQFRYHANKSRNDFVPWVKEVLHDEELAQKLHGSKTKKSASKMVSAHLKAHYQ